MYIRFFAASGDNCSGGKSENGEELSLDRLSGLVFRWLVKKVVRH